MGVMHYVECDCKDCIKAQQRDQYKELVLCTLFHRLVSNGFYCKHAKKRRTEAEQEEA